MSLSTRAKKVLIALNELCDDDGYYHGSATTVGQAIGTYRYYAWRGLVDLEESGLITWHRRERDSRGSDIYLTLRPEKQ